MKWAEAVATKDIYTIKEALKHGERPNDLSATFTIDKRGDEEAVTAVEVLLIDNRLAQDIEYMEAADKLLKEGAPLPPYPTTYEEIEPTLEELARMDEWLYIALKHKPDIIHAQDAEGKTIAHHLAKRGLTAGSNTISLVMQQLFKLPHVNLEMTDNNGFTPLHIAAIYADERVTSRYVYPNFIRAAHKYGADLTQLNLFGQSALHIAATRGHQGAIGERTNLVQITMDIVGSTFPLDSLSSRGASILTHAINSSHFDAAATLLHAGADPLAGLPGQQPLDEIERQLNIFQNYISLINARNSNILEVWLIDEKHRDFIRGVLCLELERDSISDAELIPLTAELASNLEATADDLNDGPVAELKALKQQVLSAISCNKQRKESGMKFPFWGRKVPKEDEAAWASVSVADTDADKPAGPGYGF